MTKRIAVSTGGPTAMVPPASVPLGFLVAGAVGLVTFGLGTAYHAGVVVDAPRTSPDALAVTHFAMLTFLTTAVMGALHQFAPVVGVRPLRSIVVARVTFVTLVVATWLLPAGFAHFPTTLVIPGALVGATAVCLAAWNLSGPLSSREGGVPVVGLRLSVIYLLVTVTFGVVYALDRNYGWFPLAEHRVLAHAHLGLLGWLGLTYISVAEKLWPMFLLAHRPKARSGAWAVGLVATGTAVLATGLLFAWSVVTVAGAVVVAAGLGAHLTSLAGAVRHRRRPLELLHVFLFISAAFLVVGVGLGAVAGLAPLSPKVRSHLVTAEVASLVAWLGLAVIGHSHKIVPFITFSRLRERGVTTNRHGTPLLFADLFDHKVAVATLAIAASGFALLVAGLAVGVAALVVAGGTLVGIGGAAVALNLGLGPRRAVPASARQDSEPELARTT